MQKKDKDALTVAGILFLLWLLKNVIIPPFIPIPPKKTPDEKNKDKDEPGQKPDPDPDPTPIIYPIPTPHTDIAPVPVYVIPPTPAPGLQLPNLRPSPINLPNLPVLTPIALPGIGSTYPLSAMPDLIPPGLKIYGNMAPLPKYSELPEAFYALPIAGLGAIAATSPVAIGVGATIIAGTVGLAGGVAADPVQDRGHNGQDHGVVRPPYKAPDPAPPPANPIRIVTGPEPLQDQFNRMFGVG
jgi:hypothetical protein